MRLLNFTIIKLLTFLILGILFGFNFNIEWKLSLGISLALITFLFGFYKYFDKKYLKTELFGFFTFVTTFCIGILIQTFHQKSNHLNHYSNLDIDKEVSLQFKIYKHLNTGYYYDRYEVNILSINNNEVSGRVILNVNKDSFPKELNIDDAYASKAFLKKVLSPLNPNQFDYKNYLKKKGIYHQLYLKPAELFKLSSSTNTIYGFADSLREKINKSLKEHSFKDDELSIINALLLGQRQDISDEVYANYTNAGAIHILAVSGLHVGIILLLLNLLLKPLENFKKGNTIKLIVILILLWCFAVIAGLSASVVRAVTMFSFIAYAMHIKRATNIFNILAISMFILLLFKPSFLFDVGFQLSYVAVFTIVWVQPMLYKLWSPKLKAIDYIWQLFTVTLAAQLGILPLSLFYFHQFPGLFFVSNLVIIPFLGFILGMGILVIILAVLNILPQLIANLYGSIISFMNNFISWIANQEGFLFRDISFNWKQLIGAYILIISFILLLKKPKPKRIISFLIAILIFQGVFIYNKYDTGQSQKFIVFHKSRHTLLASHHGNKLTLNKSEYKNDYTISNYKIGNAINSIESDSFQNIYSLRSEKLLVIDSLGIYEVKSLSPEYILLTNSPKINLTRLIDSLHPKQIIADGSNYKSYIKSWKVTCQKEKIPFHNTNEKGAFIIDLN